MRRHPHLYEINTWPWLDRLSRQEGRMVTLGSVPDAQWDALANRGIDLVYLLGVWRRSLASRELARAEPSCRASYDEALSGWTVDDVVGSAFATAGYQPDARIGTMHELDGVRRKLHARGMQLIVDFIPNHVGLDHPWIAEHRDRFFPEEGGGVAPARDPYFPPWSDVAQLDYSREETRLAMVGELKKIAEHADGARCDMAMLVLSDVFARTWQGRAQAGEWRREFWTDARDAVPGFLLIAEVYWDLEWRLQQLGFDFTYDKRLYDRLLHGSATDVHGHLQADADYQRRSARFIENHDEPRSAPTFGARATAAAALISTVPGLRFYFDGQFEGRQVRLPVQLGRELEELPDRQRETFYRRLLAVVDMPIFHEGAWRLCDTRPINDTSANLVAWRWKHGQDLALVVVNLGESVAQGHVDIAGDLPTRSTQWIFEDLIAWERYERNLQELVAHGLYVRLGVGGAHIFSVTASG